MAESSKDPLESLREHARKELGFMMGALLVHGESSLMAQARQARGSAEQTQLNDAIRELRLKGRALQELFLEGVRAAFEEPPGSAPEHSRRSSSQAAKPVPAALGVDSLGVVNDAHLQQQIVTGNIASRAMHDHREALLSIGRELARRSGSRRVDIESLPISPQRLATLFMDNCARLGVESSAMNGFARLFTRFVFDELGPFYQDCLKLFPAESEAEPSITVAPLEKASSDVLPVARPRDEPPTPAVRKTIVEAESWDTSRTPLVLPPGKAVAMPRNQLDDGLMHVQERLLDTDEGFLSLKPETPPVLLPIRELLNESLAQSGFTRPMSLPADAVETMGKVRQLIEHALSNMKLPPAIRHVMGLLEVPFIRLAMREPEMLSLDNHPSRVLLNEMATAAAIRPDAGDPEKHDFPRLVQLLVMRVLGDYDKDSAVFRAALDDLRRYLAVHGTEEEREAMRSHGGGAAAPSKPAPIAAAPARPPASPEFQALVDKIPLEGWIELRARGAERRRLQLATRVPRSGVLIFSDESGEKAGEWSRNDLASMIENGEAVILKAGSTQSPGRR